MAATAAAASAELLLLLLGAASPPLPSPAQDGGEPRLSGGSGVTTQAQSALVWRGKNAAGSREKVPASRCLATDPLRPQLPRPPTQHERSATGAARARAAGAGQGRGRSRSLGAGEPPSLAFLSLLDAASGEPALRREPGRERDGGGRQHLRAQPAAARWVPGGGGHEGAALHRPLPLPP